MHDILIARMLYPVKSLGPGKRLGIWLCGCHRRCPCCANPELQAFDLNRKIHVDDAAAMIQSVLVSHPVDGLTISGGEPFEQAAMLAAVFDRLGVLMPDDVLIFTGYTMEALRDRKDPDTDRVLHRASVVIDGDYREEFNTGSVLRGSDNQRILILKPEYQERYQQYINTGKRLYESFSTSEGVFMIGLHEKGFRQKLDEQKKKHGLA